jgi:hypothetical protein
MVDARPGYAPATAIRMGHRMRTGTRLMMWMLLVACLGGCGPAAQPESQMDQAAAAAPASAPSTAPSAADAGLAIAVARETADRAVREQTLHVQKQLREQQRQLRQAREAVERGDGGERCLAGQKMRRVANGWVQAGPC